MSATPTTLSMAGPDRIVVRIDERDMPALAFPIVYPKYTRPIRMVVIAIVAAMLLGGIVTFVVSFSRVESPGLAAARIALVLGGAVLLTFLVLQIQSFPRPAFVAVLAEGIYSRTGGISTFVPWEILTASGPYEFAGCRYLGVRTSRPPRTRPGWLHVFRPLNRRTAGWDLTYPIFVMPGGPAFAHLVERCLAHPEARATVASGAQP